MVVLYDRGLSPRQVRKQMAPRQSLALTARFVRLIAKTKRVASIQKTKEFKRSLPDCCLLISVAPEKLAHLSHKFRATEEDRILNLRLPVRLSTSYGCRFPPLLTKRVLELALRTSTEKLQDGLGA